MTWRQVKQRMARMKLHLFLFHLKFVKRKKVFTILALKQPNSEKRIFAAYKYSKRLSVIIFRYDIFMTGLLSLKS